MSGRGLRPGNVASAAVVVGGVLLVAFPQHAWSIVRLVIVTIAAASAVYVLVAHVPPTGWMSPFTWMSPFHDPVRRRARHRSVDEIDLIASHLGARRQAIEGGPAMPPAVLRLLKPLIEVALDVDARDRRAVSAARARIDPVTWAVLASDPLDRPTTLRTMRPDRASVTHVVHRVLDDLDRVTTGARPYRPSPSSPTIAR